MSAGPSGNPDESTDQVPQEMELIDVAKECEIAKYVDIASDNSDKILKVGDQFPSYAALESKIEEYQKCVFNNFWKRDSRSLENEARKFPGGVADKANKDLVYHYIRYSCLKGGRDHKARNKVRNTKTFRQGCGAGMFVKISPCGKFLRIIELNEEHNHESSKPLFDAIKNQRLNLPEETKRYVKRALKCGEDKKHIQNEILSQTGCLVTLKDLSNMNKAPEREKKSFEDCIKILEDLYKCDVEVRKDNKGNLLGSYFQDQTMKNALSSFPEIIFVDGTYCLHANRSATYLIIVEDSNGNACVAAVGILSQEDEKAADWFVETFKKKNDLDADQIKLIMSDKDVKERFAFLRHFPDAALVISLFHTLQHFNKEICPRSMEGMTKEECDLAKQYFQKLACSSSEEKYLTTLAEMKEKVAKPAVNYFDENWSPIKEQWALCYNFSNESLLSNKNYKLGSLNQKLKGIIQRYSNFEDFIKYFFVTINSVRCYQNSSSSLEMHKISTKKYPAGSTEDSYQKLLTSHAFGKVLGQMKQAEAYKDEPVILTEDMALLPTSEGMLEVKKDSCECLFYKAVKLPCSHIFKVRAALGLTLYDDDLCSERWKREYLKGRI